MCLNVSNGRTTNFKKKFSNRTQVIVWKALSTNTRGKLCTPFRYTEIPSNGILRSNRTTGCNLTTNEKSSTQINRGIHVYLTTAAAKRQGVSYPLYPAVVYVKDLVSIGQNGDAVFTKIKIVK